MLILLAFLALAQPGECNDRTRGLSQCVEYAGTPPHVTCKAVCYYGKREDGGVFSKVLKKEGASEGECLQHLKDDCK